MTEPYPVYHLSNNEEMIVISKSDWNTIFLQHNPFDLSPPTNPEHAIWAGMDKIKQHFNDIFDVAASFSAAQVVLNQGPYGVGKTHASVYFRNKENLPQFIENGIKVHQINICAPKESENPVEEFYTNILDAIGMTQIAKILQDATTDLPKGYVIDILHKILGSEELAKAFWLLATTDSVEDSGNYYALTS